MGKDLNYNRIQYSSLLSKFCCTLEAIKLHFISFFLALSDGLTQAGLQRFTQPIIKMAHFPDFCLPYTNAEGNPSSCRRGLVVVESL